VDKKESPEFKSIKVSDETHSRLAKLGSVGQTFEDVIKSLIDEHDNIEESKVKSKK
jgi:predicted CopG family antitoxin